MSRIAYLGAICQYDGGDFNTFPERTGWDLSEETDQMTRMDGMTSTLLEQLALFQAWLFFGLLSKTFSIVGVTLDPRHFIKNTERQNEITVDELSRYIRRWHHLEQGEVIDAQKKHLREVLTLLQYAGDQVDSFLSFPRLRYAEDHESSVCLIVAESIAMLGDSLYNATKHIWQHLKNDIVILEGNRIRKTLRFSEPATLSLKRLEQRGWCKSTRVMMHRLVDTSGLFYAGMLDRPKMPTDHSKCSTTDCVVMTIVKDTYQVAHVCQGRSCPMVIVDSTQVAAVIHGGRIPCVSFSAGVCGESEILVSDSNAGYVAFSHVWAHGLGNPNVNGLPRCQLGRLQKLANAIWQKRNKSSINNEHPMRFWIDTLCIPVGKELNEARNLSILSLTQVFGDASTVLVLDSELVEVSISVWYLEKELRLITSDWMRRVWTLQEALFTKPGNLYWQFREEALAASEIWPSDEQHDPLHISYRVSAFEKRLPVIPTVAESSLSLSNNFLSIIYALRYRSLSRIEDETICIAPLLGLGRAELLQTGDHIERIKIFLSLWEEVPSYLLFMEGAHIDQPGHRWLPSSFVRGIHKSTVSRAREQFTRPGPAGLYVTFPGIFLTPQSDLTCLYCNIGFWNELDGLWYCVKDLGKIFESKLPSSQRWEYHRAKLQQLKRPAFILEYPSQYSENYIVAVLVDVTHEQDGVYYARYLCRVWLSQCNFDERSQIPFSRHDTLSWPPNWYEDKIRGYSTESKAGFQSASPPSRETFQMTSTVQRWCVG